MKGLLILCALFCANTSIAQAGFPNYYEYSRYIREADSLYKVKSFHQSAIIYSKALQVNVEKGIQIPYIDLHYTIGYIWALSGNADSAFAYLIKAAELGFAKVDQLNTNTALQGLKTDNRWSQVVTQVSNNERKAVERKRIYAERITFRDSSAIIFNPPDEYARKFLYNDDFPFISVNHGHFRLYFQGNSFAANNLADIKMQLSLAMERVVSVLNIKSYTKGINLVFVDTKEEMNKLTGLSVSGGLAIPESDVVFLVYNGTRRLQAKHEIFHVVSTKTWGLSKSRLLNEGSAVFADNECYYDNPIYSINAYLLKQKKTFPLQALINDFDNKARENDVIAYLQSAAIFKYLYENYGIDKLKQLWVSGFSAFGSIYGFSAKQLEKDWINHIKMIPPPKEVDLEKLFNEGCG